MVNSLPSERGQGCCIVRLRGSLLNEFVLLWFTHQSHEPCIHYHSLRDVNVGTIIGLILFFI